jgi:hypothetical protein BACCOPRO_03032
MKRLVYLGENLLQQDMRLRLPKSVLINLDVEAGKSIFEIYLDVESKEIVLKASDKQGDRKNV